MMVKSVLLVGGMASMSYRSCPLSRDKRDSQHTPLRHTNNEATGRAEVPQDWLSST